LSLVPDILTALRNNRSVFGAELRPPRAELEASAGMDAWIDTYHAVRRLTRAGTYVFLTDSAVGAQEEDNLRHLVTNLQRDVPRERIVPFLTSKHALDYCLSYAERARQNGFPALVVLGGDQKVGTPRSVEHAWQLREMLRQRNQQLALGGWANPHSDPERQVEFLLDGHVNAEFYLTQIVSHHDRDKVERFFEASARRGLDLPGIFGVFFFRSANPKTLAALKRFLPVPAEALTRDFEAGKSAEDVCAESIRTLLAAGVRHFYISNLPIGTASQTLASVLDRAGARPAPESAGTLGA
jgi:5,10-methylenetetrahydrofolate reductase